MSDCSSDDCFDFMILITFVVMIFVLVLFCLVSMKNIEEVFVPEE